MAPLFLKAFCVLSEPPIGFTIETVIVKQSRSMVKPIQIKRKTL
ncbi:hypothetical protein MNBD_ALPHA11-778 [hydrothermal vent metagenome]|uniref:Uncharacterized protein n=1 Tax=hydrothermal vent metagenome TaxID=652676 RepID=A0A3B0UIB0_9ZZZZ